MSQELLTASLDITDPICPLKYNLRWLTLTKYLYSQKKTGGKWSVVRRVQGNLDDTVRLDLISSDTLRLFPVRRVARWLK